MNYRLNAYGVLMGSLLTVGVTLAYQHNGLTAAEIISTLFIFVCFSFSMSLCMNLLNFGLPVTLLSALLALMLGYGIYLSLQNLGIAIIFGGLMCLSFSLVFSLISNKK